MNKKLTCISITLNIRGAVQFSEVNEKNQPVNDVLITINFKDPKEAAKFEHGKAYTISVDTSSD